MLEIIFLFIGVIIGSIITIIFSYKKPYGRIVLDKTDPYFATAGIEFYIGANEIAKLKCVVLEVDSHY